MSLGNMQTPDEEFYEMPDGGLILIGGGRYGGPRGYVGPPAPYRPVDAPAGGPGDPYEDDTTGRAYTPSPSQYRTPYAEGRKTPAPGEVTTADADEAAQEQGGVNWAAVGIAAALVIWALAQKR